MRINKSLTAFVVMVSIIVQTFSLTSMATDKANTQMGSDFYKISEQKPVEVDTLKQDGKSSDVSEANSGYTVEKNDQSIHVEKYTVQEDESIKNSGSSNSLTKEEIELLDSEKAISTDSNGKAVGRSKKEIIVVYNDISKADKSKSKFSSNKAQREIKTKYKSNRFKMELLEVLDQNSTEEVMDELRRDPNIKYVQPDYELNTFYIPEDEHFDKQWALENNGQIVNNQAGTAGFDINVKDAWDITTGNNDVIVAVLDTGIDINHEDIAGNVFINTNEIPNNGIDDDLNSYVDDYYGWDFVNDDNTVDDLSTNDVHGSHVAGIIMAKSNEIGTIGVAPGIKLLPIKFIEGNSGKTSDAVKGIDYALDMGASIINCSWGGYEYNQILKDTMEQSNAIFICAAGNSSSNNTVRPIYPASFDLDNVISVAAIDCNGELASFSNYGNNVDIAAPGTNILSTYPNNRYDYISGTSMAAPFVTGVIALIKSADPTLSVADIKSRILNNTTRTDKLSGKVKTSGIVNAHAALLNQAPSSSEEEDENSDEETSVEPKPIYDTSAEGNNKTPKPVLNSGKQFIGNEEIKIPLEGQEIENLNIYSLGENNITVTWVTYAESNSGLYLGNTENLGIEFIDDKLTTNHKISTMVDNLSEIEYYKIRSVTLDGTVFETEIRRVGDGIVDVNSIMLQDISTLSYIFDNNSNNSLATSQSIGECTVFGTMSQANEWDYYSINFEASKTYTIRLTGMDYRDDYDLYLLNSYGDIIKQSLNGKTYDDLITHSISSTGIYYLAVKTYTYSLLAEHHNYQLLVYSEDNEPDIYEPNDSMGTAKTIIDGDLITASININTDEDWYVIDATETGKLSVSLKSIPEGCDYDLLLYNNNGACVGGSYASGNLEEKIDYLINSVGKYYIRVYSYIGEDPVNNYELLAGIYTPDNYELNDSIYDARYYSAPAVSIDSSITDATIDNINDFDYYVLNLTEDMNVGIRLQNIPSDNDYNLVLYTYTLYTGFTEVARSLHSGNTDESIVRQLPAASYYIKVYSASGCSQTVPYKLSVSNESNATDFAPNSVEIENDSSR